MSRSASLIMTSPNLLTQETLNDIQGFIVRGYGHLRHSAYVFVRIENAQSGQQWLGRLAPSITTAQTWPSDADGKRIQSKVAINIAVTAAGLTALGLPQIVLRAFAPEFIEGVASEQRAHILGDHGTSAAAQWELGGPQTEAMHAVLIIHAQDEATLDAVCAAQRALLTVAGSGIREVSNGLQHGYRPASDCEPFGFRDNIAQPKIRGLNTTDNTDVPAGEFILGHENHYGLIAPTPVVAGELDAKDLLPSLANPYHAGKSLRDLGSNGSYIVYRKLQQDVAAFWQFMKQEAARIDGTADPARMIWLAAKCVGRWPSGAPLTLAPDADDIHLAQRDDFLYGTDAQGYGCPWGAHVRRTNPRDALKPYPAPQSLSMTDAHRILRRGRVFGAPLFDPLMLQRALTPDEQQRLLNLADDGEPRGLHFLCVNASIKSQFEFIQQSWCNNPRFGALNDNPDPLISGGTDAGKEAGTEGRMTIPGQPQGVRTAPLSRFVTVRAGAYFFMPSLSALRFLAALGSPA